jgi:hypothetical protein
LAFELNIALSEAVEAALAGPPAAAPPAYAGALA